MYFSSFQHKSLGPYKLHLVFSNVLLELIYKVFNGSVFCSILLVLTVLTNIMILIYHPQQIFDSYKIKTRKPPL